MTETLVLVLDTEGALLAASPNAEGLTGCCVSEAVGQPFAERFLVAEDRAVFAEKIVAAVRGAAANAGFTARVHSQGGEVRAFAWTMTPLDQGAGLQGIVVIGHESTAEAFLRGDPDRRGRDKTIFLAMSEMMFILDRDGTIIDFKTEDEADLPVPPGDAVGRSLRDIGFPAEMATQFLAAVGRTLDTAGIQTVEYELTSTLGAGSYEARLVPYHDEQVLALVRNITKRKRAEQDLRESRRTLETLISNLPGIVYRSRNDRDWTKEFLGGGCVALTGYSAGELLEGAVGYSDLIDPEDRDAIWDAVQLALAERRPFEIVYRIVARDGSRKWVWEQGRGIRDAAGALLALEGFITDITRRKDAETQVEKLSRAIDQAHDMIVITDRSGAIEFVNPAFEIVTGYAAADVLGKNPRILQSGLHDRKFYQEMWSTIASARVWTGDLFNRKRDGTRFEERMTITPIRDSTGEVTHFVAIKRDVTEERKIARRLRQTQKMEAIGQLAGGIAHDFNNMLTVINEGARYLAENSAAETETVARARQIYDAGRRCAEMTRNLLTFARPTAFQPQPLRLDAVVEAAVALLGPLIGRTIAIETSYDSPPPVVLAAAGQIQQVVTNLCINARDAMADGGRIAIRADGPATVAAEAGEAATPAGRFCRLRVSDNGIGMDDETCRRAIEPFFTTKPAGAGTGLGLAVVYGIVETHHGTIDIRSQPGRGTTVDIYLPAGGMRSLPVSDGSPEHARRPAAKTEAVGILVVDDEKTVAAVARSVLTRAGHTVWVAHSGADAVELYAREKGNIRCVLIDQNMPRMSGRECLERIQRITPSVAAVLTSGFYDGDVAAGLSDATFLQKPYGPDELLGAVRDSLGHGP